VRGAFFILMNLIYKKKLDSLIIELIKRCGSIFKHIKIQNNGEYFEMAEGGDKFASLMELVQHFTQNEVLRDKLDGSLIHLKYPLNCKEPTNERYFHGSISGTEAANLLLAKGKLGSYLVRESRTDPVNYVLCVRCENNKVVHLVINYNVRLIVKLYMSVLKFKLEKIKYF
jgi:hypothetical protein